MAMTPKLVHISDEVHALLKQHCKKHGLSMKAFVSGLVLDAVNEAKRCS